MNRHSHHDSHLTFSIETVRKSSPVSSTAGVGRQHGRYCCRVLIILAGLLAVIADVACGAEETRTWTSRDGKYTTRAEFLKLEEGNVHLRKENGNVVEVPLERLSDKDRTWVRNRVRRSSRDQSKPGRRRKATEPSKSIGAVGSATQTDDWFQWRGPNRDGKSPETGLLQDWKARRPPLLWTAHDLGGGRSSVVVTGGKIFTMGSVGGKTCLIALSEENGELLWKTPIDRPGNVNCTPTVAGNRVYGISFHGTLACADTDSGKLVWSKNFARDFGGRMMSGWGYAESPLVDGDRVIVTPGGNQAMMVALDGRTGKLIWKTAVGNLGPRGKDGAGYSSAVVSRAGGVRQYVQLVGRGLIGVSAQTGQLLWSYNRIANSTANIPTPIVTGDFVFCSTGYQTGAALLRLVRQGNRMTAHEVYFLPHDRLQNHHGGVILLGDYLFCGHGHNQGFPTCIHVPTGRTAWGPLRGPGKRSAAVSYADGHLYFRYEDGTMALIEANPRSYKLKGTFRIATRHAESWPHPVIANGKLYLRDQQDLHCYDLRAE